MKQGMASKLARALVGQTGLVGIAAAVAAAVAASSAAAAPLRFERVQPELFNTSGSLANAWGDYDGDGDLDLAITFKSGDIRLYRNDRGVFVDASTSLGFKSKGDEMRGVAWGDYDGDGDLDLYLNTRPQRYLLRNDGSAGFTDITQSMGVEVPGANGRQANFVDYDNDGDVDLFLADRSGPNRLFRNDAGRLTDVASEVGLADTRHTIGACWFDMDQDGDLDVFQPNQAGDTDALFRNDRTRFVDIAPQVGTHRPGRTPEEGGVGCTVGDYDNDGDFDVFVAAYGTSLLYRNDGNSRFTEVARTVGVDVQGHMVAASWGDYDADGRLDLFVTGYVGDGPTARPDNRLYRNLGKRFENQLFADAALNAADHGVQWGDYDGDGDLDLSLTQGYPADGQAYVFRNLTPGAAGRSLLVEVADARGAPTQAGAEVRVYDRRGRLLGARLVSTGDGYDSQSVVPVHFGLRRSGPVTVEVTFLTPAGRKAQRVENVNPARLAGRRLVVRQAN